MCVFVLGAGASIHAGYPSMAAMGEQLAAWAERDEVEGPRYREELRQLQEDFGGFANFEESLTRLRQDLAAKKRGVILDLGTAVSKFFDSIRNKPGELYDRFAKERVQRRDVVITFNYDLAIERSLKAAGVWEIIDGYGAAFTLEPRETPLSQVRVLKLHGSTNWWGSLFGGATGYGAVQSSVGERPVLFFEPDFMYLGYEGLRDPKAPANSALISPLIWPTLKKEFYLTTTFGKEWEPFWNALWLEAEHALRATDEIVVIGYSLPPADERARDLLLAKSNRDSSVTVCSHSQSQRVADEFKRHGFNRVTVPLSPTFEGWLD
jgi:hypothetical protein